MLRSYTVTQKKVLTDAYKWGVDDDFVFESENLAAPGAEAGDLVVDIGTVLGKIGRGAVAVGAVTFAGVGNGTLTKADPAVAAATAQAGSYKAVCVEKTANSGLFAVLRPDGTIDGHAVIGTAYDGQVKFTIADGDTDFSQGDMFSLPVTVSAGSDKVVPLDLDATDGSQNAYGVAASNIAIAAGGSDQAILAVVRGPAILREQGLTWPAGITAGQKALAVAALAAKGIVIRPS